jgi:O-antigen ligase
MSLFVPTTYQPIKVVFLGFGLILLVINGNLKIHVSVLFWILLMITSDVLFQVEGFINGGKGSLRVSTVTIMWPLCYIIIISSLNKIEYFIKIFKILLWATKIIIIHTFLLFLSSLNIISNPFPNIDVGYRIGFYNSFTEYSTYNMSSLLFTVPVIFTLWITKLNTEYLSKLTYLLVCLLILILMIVSGRTIFQLNLVFILFINFFMIKKYRKNNFDIIGLSIILFFSVLLALIIINYIYEIDIQLIISAIKGKFDFKASSNTSGGIRGSQFKVLIEGWQEKPLFGWGEGVGAGDKAEGSWAYELVYVARLFQTGIIGTILYFSFIFWIIYRCMIIINKKNHLSKITYSILNGFICFMIANATNPYLGKFDYMWVIYLPLAIINYDLLAVKNYSLD